MNEPMWGSDAMAAALRELDFAYAALVPGSSYRGLHDSLVNYLGAENPQLLVCLHEEHAVAIAHGYAKVTGRPMLALLHSNVGLMHAAMAIFNAWCDRMPVVVIGATGPWDAQKRRPWMEWTHTSADQGALVRDYTKWDDQPGSVPAAVESLVHAAQIARTYPSGPVYVNLDSGLQEEPLSGPIPLPDPTRFGPPRSPSPSADDVAAVLRALRGARRPVLVVGRMSRNPEDWNARVALAEALGARVVGDLRSGAAFPTDHPLFVGPAAQRLPPQQARALREADVVLGLDPMDFGGTLRTAWGGDPIAATIIQCSMDRYLQRGWGKEYAQIAPVDVDVVAPPDALVHALLGALDVAPATAPPAAPPPPPVEPDRSGEAISDGALERAVSRAFHAHNPCWTMFPLAFTGASFTFRHPLDYLGFNGGGGVGGGPGIAVGAALALQGSGRLPVAVLGDGDFLMGGTALWTAVANRIPLLVVVANNRSYFNDEVHQERTAIKRGRPVERKWIGQRLDGPAPDLAMFARSQGAEGIGPVRRFEELDAALAQALAHVRDGKVCVVDVHVEP